MKIQIDTQAKTIKLEQSAKLTELFKIVQKFLPNGEWKEYTIDANTVITQWYNPIYWPINVNPYNPYGNVMYLTSDCGTTAGDSLVCTTDTAKTLASGTPQWINIETN